MNYCVRVFGISEIQIKSDPNAVSLSCSQYQKSIVSCGAIFSRSSTYSNDKHVNLKSSRMVDLPPETRRRYSSHLQQRPFLRVRTQHEQ